MSNSLRGFQYFPPADWYLDYSPGLNKVCQPAKAKTYSTENERYDAWLTDLMHTRLSFGEFNIPESEPKAERTEKSTLSDGDKGDVVPVTETVRRYLTDVLMLQHAGAILAKKVSCSPSPRWPDPNKFEGFALMQHKLTGMVAYVEKTVGGKTRARTIESTEHSFLQFEVEASEWVAYDPSTTKHDRKVE